MKNQNAKTFFLIVVFCGAILGFSGCQTLQRDIIASVADEETHAKLLELEELIVRLDNAPASRQNTAQARQQVTALRGSVVNSAIDGILTAWSGQLSLMEGRASDARRDLQRSQSVSPHNVPAQVLSFRLERDLSERLAMIDRSIAIERSSGELFVERGRALFEMNRFSESVAAFDTAFVLLVAKPFYEDVYRAQRDNAWELRSLEQTVARRTMDIVLQPEITWRDLIEITQSETDLLRFMTAGRNFSSDTLFAQLLDRGFIPRTQDATLTEWPGTRPAPTDVVLRAGAAWLLWHLNAENRANRDLLTRYSTRFATMTNPRSPILDLDIHSPFVDSILGCVEFGFMFLPDGRNFMPHERVAGADFLAMLRRL